MPIKSNSENPRVKFHILADVLVWEDEGIAECNPALKNAFRSVLNYRTALISKKSVQNFYNKQIFELSKKYFPN